MAAGDIVNTAFRLAEAAPVNGILVDESTYRATYRFIEFGASDPVQAKGKAAPQFVWQAIAPRVRLGQADLHVAHALIGRQEELRRLLDAFDRIREERRPQLVTITGDPGIGKSRMILELVAELDARPGTTYWRQGRSLPYGEETPFWALAEILTPTPASSAPTTRRSPRGSLAGGPRCRARGRRGGMDSRDHARPRRTERGRSHSRRPSQRGIRRLAPLLRGVGGAPALGDRVRGHSLGRRRALGVHRSSGVPVLERPAADRLQRPAVDLRTPSGLGRRGLPCSWNWSRSRDDTAALIAALLRDAVLPKDAERDLLTRAEGNPLYAQEYVRMLVDRGYLRRGADGWHLGRLEQPLPESVQGIIAARLDALPLEEKSLVQSAAVIGRTFWFDRSPR